MFHFPESKDFQSEVYATDFGRFIAGTEYADYAVGNQFGDAHTDLISQKTAKARYLWSLETDAGTFTVWYDMMVDTYFILERRPKKEILFTLDEGRMSENKTLMNYTDRPLATLRSAFKHARVAFDTPQTRNAFLEIYKK